MQAMSQTTTTRAAKLIQLHKCVSNGVLLRSIMAFVIQDENSLCNLIDLTNTLLSFNIVSNTTYFYEYVFLLIFYTLCDVSLNRQSIHDCNHGTCSGNHTTGSVVMQD